MGARDPPPSSQRFTRSSPDCGALPTRLAPTARSHTCSPWLTALSIAAILRSYLWRNLWPPTSAHLRPAVGRRDPEFTSGRWTWCKCCKLWARPHTMRSQTQSRCDSEIIFLTNLTMLQPKTASRCHTACCLREYCSYQRKEAFRRHMSDCITRLRKLSPSNFMPGASFLAFRIGT